MANQKQEPSQEIKIKINDEELKGVYANLMRVTHQRGEFILDFANVIPPAGIVTARVITSPAHLKSMIQVLRENMEIYEKKFGGVEASSQPKQGMGF